MLSKAITNQEIYDAFFDMAPLKASGLDGLHAQFYQTQWHIVDKSLILMVRLGFEKDQIEEFLNKNLMVLIPKVAGPEVVQ